MHAKLLRPTKDRDQKEILVVNSKRRVYYPVKDSGLQYQVSGPTRVEFISRYQFFEDEKKATVLAILSFSIAKIQSM